LSPVLHTIRFWAVTTVLSFVLGSLAVLYRFFDPSGNASHRISSLWGRLLCEWNGIEVEIEGLENIMTGKAQIFVANHQSFFDIFTLSGYLPTQIRWMAKASLFRIPFVGWAMWASSYIPVEREDRKKSYQAFLTTVERIKSGASVVIFPEGTRSENGSIGEFKKGSHLLSARSGAPMTPVTIIGTGTIICKGSFAVNPGKVKIIISPAIKSDSEETLNKIRDIICKCYQENTL